jgi:hypothetical protein
MDATLNYLRTKTIDDVPQRIRGKVMRNLSHPEYIHYNGKSFYVGLDANSCTSTTTAVFFFLTRIPLTLDEIGMKYNKQSFCELPNSLETNELQLYSFHTPYHKFSILRQGECACFLQSNQDAFTTIGAPIYTLQDYLVRLQSDSSMFLCRSSLEQFFNDLCIAEKDADKCPDIFYSYFGIRWKQSSMDDYWFTQVCVEL